MNYSESVKPLCDSWIEKLRLYKRNKMTEFLHRWLSFKVIADDSSAGLRNACESACKFVELY